MSAGSERVIKWRALTKKRIIDAMGGSCAICNYSRAQSALELHHLDPTEKEFGLGTVRASPISWERICVELRKCVLLCSICHREVHEGMIEVPDAAPKFDEAYTDYKALTADLRLGKCPVCEGPKRMEARTCSAQCPGQQHNRADWSKHDLAEMAKTMRVCEISAAVGLSPSAISKRLKKLRLE